MVQWLWQVVNELTPEERKLFLKFFTGSDRAPIGGLGNLRCIIQVRATEGCGQGWMRCCSLLRGLLTLGCLTGYRLLVLTLPTLTPHPHCLQRDGPDSNRLPTSHTCFNSLLLPSYRSKDKLADRLKLAILNSEGFGLE